MISKYIYYPVFILFLVACQTVDQDTQRILFTKKTPTESFSQNPYNSSFTANITGSYIMTDETPLIIRGDGSFNLGESTYSLHEALNETQAVYVAATPDEKITGRNRYTYHGIYNNGRQLFVVPFKIPSGTQVRIDSRQSDHAWEANTFQPENINWGSGLLTLFASKDGSAIVTESDNS